MTSPPPLAARPSCSFTFHPVASQFVSRLPNCERVEPPRPSIPLLSFCPGRIWLDLVQVDEVDQPVALRVRREVPGLRQYTPLCIGPCLMGSFQCMRRRVRHGICLAQAPALAVTTLEHHLPVPAASLSRGGAPDLGGTCTRVAHQPTVHFRPSGNGDD
eukprot:248142-Prymnesium_polylepis.1